MVTTLGASHIRTSKTEQDSPLEKFVVSVHYFNPRKISIFRLNEMELGEKSYEFIGFYNGNVFELVKNATISNLAKEDAISLYNNQYYMGKERHYDPR